MHLDKASWRKYRIRRIYWETCTFSKKEAERQSNELRRQEEREAEEVGETSTGTEADLPVRLRQDVTKLPSQEASTLTPPSAPNSVPRVRASPRKHLPKPPPCSSMVQKAKKTCPATPRTSDEEARDPSWIQKGPGKKQDV